MIWIKWVILYIFGVDTSRLFGAFAPKNRAVRLKKCNLEHVCDYRIWRINYFLMGTSSTFCQTCTASGICLLFSAPPVLSVLWCCGWMGKRGVLFLNKSGAPFLLSVTSTAHACTVHSESHTHTGQSRQQRQTRAYRDYESGHTLHRTSNRLGFDSVVELWSGQV